MPKMTVFVPAFAAALLLAGTVVAGNLVKYKVADNAIQQSLTGKPGDAAAGEKSFTNPVSWCKCNRALHHPGRRLPPGNLHRLCNLSDQRDYRHRLAVHHHP